jgi:hypothetical protein
VLCRCDIPLVSVWSRTLIPQSISQFTDGQFFTEKKEMNVAFLFVIPHKTAMSVNVADIVDRDFVETFLPQDQ